MGNRFSRRRDAPASSAETVAAEQKTAVEPATTNPAEGSAVTQIQEVTENLDELAQQPVTSTICSPKEECLTESKEEETPAPSDPINDGDSEPRLKETPAPVQPELLVSASNPPQPEPNSVAEAQLAPEPAPEPVPEPESASYPEADSEADPDPIPEAVPAPVEALEQHADLLEQETLPEPVLSSPPLIELSAPDDTPSPAAIPFPLSSDDPSNISAGEQHQECVEASEGSSPGHEESTETLEFLEKQTEVEAAEHLETLGSDVNEGSVSEILTNSELRGNDLLNDLIPSDAKIAEASPITDMSTSIELM
ncbi:uncharacterized protein [Leuresthes tenuis]|uniref:uncharacterized protein n=1 Tax=Leuresthes tenuis TaxID=355514 RepID=UPI003B50F75C